MSTGNLASPRRTAFAAALLVALAFALGFAEFVLIGITPAVAEGLGEPLTLVGDLVGYYALACAVATPVVALATARADRFKVMAALLAVFSAGNLLTLFADDYALLLVSRMLPAATSGTLLAPRAHLRARHRGEGARGRRTGPRAGRVLGVERRRRAHRHRAGRHARMEGSLRLRVRARPGRERRPAAGAPPRLLRACCRRCSHPAIATALARRRTRAGRRRHDPRRRGIHLRVLHPISRPSSPTSSASTRPARASCCCCSGVTCVGSNLLSGWGSRPFSGCARCPSSSSRTRPCWRFWPRAFPPGVVGIANILAVGLLMYVMNSTVQMLFQDVARADYPSALTFSASLHPMAVQRGHRAGIVRGRPRGERGRPAGHRADRCRAGPSQQPRWR